MSRFSRPARRARTFSAQSLEQLEIRRLLSTINVADFGARPDDGLSDSSAIQAAINASKAGDTILFSGGVFDLSGEMTIPGSRTYQGQNGATLRGVGPNGQLLSLHADNVTFTGLTFDGGGVFVDKPGGGFNQNIVFDYNTFKVNSTGSNNNGITATSGLQNSRITNNYFTGYTSSFGIYGYNYNGLTIANNEFVNISGGVHIDAFSNSGNLLVEQNYLSGIKCMGLEFQHNASNVTFQDNFFENPNLSGNFSDNSNSFAYSLILDGATNVTIRRNTVLAPQRPDGVGVRIGFEVGGDNTLLEDNYVNGINHVVAMNDGVGTASVTVRNNRFLNILQDVSSSFPTSTRTLTTSNNGPNVNLTWDINRPRPGIGAKRFLTTQSNPPPLNDPGSTTYLSDMNWASMFNGWGPVERDQSNGEQGTGDGKTITLRGQTYAKGLGTHSNSQVVYQLDGKYTNFMADVGIDDESKGNGSVWFIVQGDGVVLYSSGVVRGNAAVKSISVDVTGKQQLSLFVYDGGDGRDFDHADWANARLTAPAAPAAPAQVPVPTPPPPTSSVSLTSLTATSVVNGWGPVETNQSNGEQASGDGKALTLNGTTYDTGLGVHANSSLTYNLDGQYSQFTSDVGVDDEVGNNGSVVFQVWLDGVKVFDSGIITGSGATQKVTINVAGKSQMKLVVTDGGDGNTFDHADWANPILGTATTI